MLVIKLLPKFNTTIKQKHLIFNPILNTQTKHYCMIKSVFFLMRNIFTLNDTFHK